MICFSWYKVSEETTQREEPILFKEDIESLVYLGIFDGKEFEVMGQLCFGCKETCECDIEVDKFSLDQIKYWSPDIPSKNKSMKEVSYYSEN